MKNGYSEDDISSQRKNSFTIFIIVNCAYNQFLKYFSIYAKNIIHFKYDIVIIYRIFHIENGKLLQ